jgi:16S rRNA (cytosine1402-N4)-methyltransferase
VCCVDDEVGVIHTPVMLPEVLSLLVPSCANALLIDGTVGEGGHSAAFLERYQDLRVIGIDRDKEILGRAERRLDTYIREGRARLIAAHTGDFFAENAEWEKAEAPDLILLDLGISRFHYEASGRGFSFSKDEKLDMRLSEDSQQSAAGIIARYREDELADMLFYNGGERGSRRVARFICEERRKSAITTTAHLAAVVHRALGFRSGAGGGIDSATRTFAALRIEVNGELARLKPLLDTAFGRLKPGGRLGVISFHSTEDRIVKNVFNAIVRDAPIIKGWLPVKKPVLPSEKEIKLNPPSRSAKLRVLEKTAG